MLCGCSPIGLQSEAPGGQKQAVSEQNQAAKLTPTQKQKPSFTPTTKPSPTEEPQVSQLENLHIGGIFYEPITLLYNQNKWNISENEFDKILVLNNDPHCKIYENIPRGLPSHSLEVETLEQKMGQYNLTLTKYTGDGEIRYAIFNFYDEMISIAVEPGSDNPANCFDAAWTVIETSAENAFGPLD